MLYKPIIENQIKINNICFPSSIMIKLTNRCNFKCGFCSQGEAKNTSINIDTVKKILDEAKMYGVSEIVYSGGEPLLYSNFEEVISYGKQQGLVQTLVTNGYFLDQYMAVVKDNISHIGISLHGDEKTHDEAVGFSGAYHKIVQNIEAVSACDKVPQLTLNFTITENNVHAIHEVITFAKMHKCTLSVARLNQIGKSSQNEKIKQTIDEFFAGISDESDIRVSNVIPVCQMQSNKRHLSHGCSAGIASVCIDADSTVRICGSATHSFGSLSEHSLYEIWNNQDFQRFRSLEWMPSLCKNCRDFAKCLGGCKAEHYENSYSDSRDCLLSMAIEDFYHRCEKGKLVPLFKSIRRIYDGYVLLGNPNRIVDEEAIALLRALIKKHNINEVIAEIEEPKRKQAVELMYGMYKDQLIAIR